MEYNTKLIRLLAKPTDEWPDTWVEDSKLSARELGKYYGSHTYLSRIIQAKKLPDLVKNAPDAIKDPELWLKASRGEFCQDYYPGVEGNSLHAAVAVGHMLHVPEHIKTIPNLMTTDRRDLPVIHMAALLGNLPDLPEYARTPKILMTETWDDEYTVYDYAVDNGSPEQIPKEHWTSDALLHLRDVDVPTLSVLIENKKMDFLASLDYAESDRQRFGKWWEVIHTFKPEMSSLGYDDVELF